MKPCRCGHTRHAHQHFNRGTYCAYWDRCHCDRYRRRRWWRRRKDTR